MCFCASEVSARVSAAMESGTMPIADIWVAARCTRGTGPQCQLPSKEKVPDQRPSA